MNEGTIALDAMQCEFANTLGGGLVSVQLWVSSCLPLVFIKYINFNSYWFYHKLEDTSTMEENSEERGMMWTCVYFCIL